MIQCEPTHPLYFLSEDLLIRHGVGILSDHFSCVRQLIFQTQIIVLFQAHHTAKFHEIMSSPDVVKLWNCYNPGNIYRIEWTQMLSLSVDQGTSFRHNEVSVSSPVWKDVRGQKSQSFEVSQRPINAVFEVSLEKYCWIYMIQLLVNCDGVRLILWWFPHKELVARRVPNQKGNRKFDVYIHI